MKVIAIAGALGRDAEVRDVNGNDVCQFSVAVDDGFGEKKTTIWFDVSRWGKGASGLANVLAKGSRVAVSGELTTREHNSKTYLQVRADKVTILSTPQGGQRHERQSSRRSAQDDLNDSIPRWDDDSQVPF